MRGQLWSAVDANSMTANDVGRTANIRLVPHSSPRVYNQFLPSDERRVMVLDAQRQAAGGS